MLVNDYVKCRNTQKQEARISALQDEIDVLQRTLGFEPSWAFIHLKHDLRIPPAKASTQRK